jgi:hypothetical protein
MSISANNNNLQIGAWICKNIGTTLDTLSVAEMTIRTSDGLVLSDVTGLGFSSGSAIGGWGASINMPTGVNLFPPAPHNTFFQKVRPNSGQIDDFQVFAPVHFRTGVQSGKIQIGLRMFNPRTGDYTTSQPVWGLEVTLRP